MAASGAMRCSAGIAEVGMGLRNWLHNKHMSDPVDGMLQLTSCSAGAYNAAYSNCRMQGVVTAPGLAPTAVEHVCLAPAKKWPQPGQMIPVLVDRADPTRLEVRWDDMPGNRELGQQQARQEAQRLAAQMSAAQAWDPADAPGQQPVTTAFPPNTMPPELQSLLDNFTQAARSSGVQVTCNVQQEVFGAPGRPVPGAAGGGLTPEQAAAAASGGGSAGGLQPATARVLAVRELPIPAGIPGAPPAGLVDLTLDVALPGGGGYATSMRIGFSTAEKRVKVATVGLTLPVLVNPAARDQIAIDTGRLG
jgi:hypothetical protein